MSDLNQTIRTYTKIGIYYRFYKLGTSKIEVSIKKLKLRYRFIISLINVWIFVMMHAYTTGLVVCPHSQKSIIELELRDHRSTTLL